MKITCSCKVTSISAISFSKYYQVPHLPKESHRDYEERTWRERLHYDEKTMECYIPPMAFKNCLSDAARYIGMKIPGKGKSTFTKHFEAGTLVVDKSYLGVRRDDVKGEWLFVPSDGKRGGGSRVEKCFPYVDPWEADINFIILDATLTKDVFELHVREMGNFIGLGRFRPRNNGYYGRFELKSMEWNVEDFGIAA